MTEKIEFVDLKSQYAHLKASIDARMATVLAHGQFIMGPEVRELEQALEVRTGTSHCVTVASGTEALLISLMAMDIGPGDEVITTPFTFIATVEVIALLGATPVFVDVEPDTCNIDPLKLEAAVSPRTRAIIPVSLYGQTADMDDINAIAARHGNIPVIEDAAQSFGATYRGRQSCNLSTIGCTSFFPSKPLGCYGDGGAIFTNDEELAIAARQIRVHGQAKRYHHTRIGVGGRMDTLQCAIVLAKLEKFAWEIDQRLEAGRRYESLFTGCNSIQLPNVRSDRTCVWGQYTIQVDQRASVLKFLTHAGVPTAVHYPTPLHRQPAYEGRYRASGALEVTDLVSSRVLSLPMHPYIDPETQEQIAHAVISAVT